jgi:hypothetical protein
MIVAAVGRTIECHGFLFKVNICVNGGGSVEGTYPARASWMLATVPVPVKLRPHALMKTLADLAL